MRELLKTSLVLSLVLPASSVQQIPASLAAIASGSSVFQNAIPEATEACTDDEAKWWKELRAAGSDFVAASRRKDQAVRSALSQSRQNGRVWSDNDDGLSGNERNKLNAGLETARQNYFRLLRQGTENSYRAPIRDTGPPVVLYTSFPNYSETARRKKTQGPVELRVEFRADGMIGVVEVVQGLGDGLDEKAVEAMRRMVFLPATKNRVFVTVSRTAFAEFNLR